MGPVQVGRGCDHHLVRSDAGLHQHEFHVVSHCRRRRWRWRLSSSLRPSSLRPSFCPSFRPRRPPLAPLPRVDQPLPQARQALVLLRPPIAVEALAVADVGRGPPPPGEERLVVLPGGQPLGGPGDARPQLEARGGPGRPGPPPFTGRRGDDGCPSACGRLSWSSWSSWSWSWWSWSWTLLLRVSSFGGVTMAFAMILGRVPANQIGGPPFDYTAII